MSVKRYKLALPSSSQKIRKAKAKLKKMPRLRKIELMVEAGAMTKARQTKRRKSWRRHPPERMQKRVQGSSDSWRRTRSGVALV